MHNCFVKLINVPAPSENELCKVAGFHCSQLDWLHERTGIQAIEGITQTVTSDLVISMGEAFFTW